MPSRGRRWGLGAARARRPVARRAQRRHGRRRRRRSGKAAALRAALKAVPEARPRLARPWARGPGRRAAAKAEALPALARRQATARARARRAAKGDRPTRSAPCGRAPRAAAVLPRIHAPPAEHSTSIASAFNRPARPSAAHPRQAIASLGRIAPSARYRAVDTTAARPARPSVCREVARGRFPLTKPVGPRDSLGARGEEAMRDRRRGDPEDRRDHAADDGGGE